METNEEEPAVAKMPEYPEFRQLERRPFRPFKSSEEYLYAMKEDLAEWLNTLYEELDLNVDNFLERLETGVELCRHANCVRKTAMDWKSESRYVAPAGVPPIPQTDVIYRANVHPGTFHARDNVSNFITWCRNLQIHDCLLFETDDLVLRKNEKSFILCLLEVARQGTKFGMLAPLLVQMEQEIDEELARDQQKEEGDSDEGHEADDDDSSDNTEAPAQVITNDLKSLHEMVKDLLNRCTCPFQFPMIRVSEGKYRIGDTKVLIFVRILRNHVMVRVGGGWDTLAHYLDKHDPCRCRSGHRASTSAKLNVVQQKTGSSQMHVTYNRLSVGGISSSKSNQQTPVDSHQRNRKISSHALEKEKFSKIIRFTDEPEADRQNLTPRARRIQNRPLSQLSDESSASSIGMSQGSPHQTNGSSTIAHDSSSEFSENEARVGSWVAGVQARKCSPRKVLRIGNEENEEMCPENGVIESVGMNRYSSDCSSVMSPEEITLQNSSLVSPASPKTITGNGSDSSGIDVSCENIQDIERSKLVKPVSAELLRNSRIPTPKIDFKSKIPPIVKTLPSTGLKRGTRIKSQSTDSLNNQQSYNRQMEYSKQSQNVTQISGGRRRSSSHTMSTPTTRLPRSRSASGEGMGPAFNIMREGPGRFSYRNPRANELTSPRSDISRGNKTWTFRQRDNRPVLSYETYMNPTAASQQRRVSSESPKRRLPLKSSENSARLTPVKKLSQSAKTSPSPEISPILQQILSNEDDLSDDTKILQKMEMIVNQYKARVEANLKRQNSKENSDRARWNSTGDLSDEGMLNTKSLRPERKLSAPPSPVAATDPIKNFQISPRQRRSSLGASNSKIPMPRWYTKNT